MYKSINYQIMFIKKSNMLTIVTGNYNNLKQMLPDEELSQKRKAGNDDYDNFIRNITFNHNISSGDRWSPALLKVVKFPEVYVKINQSDTSLVVVMKFDFLLIFLRN